MAKAKPGVQMMLTLANGKLEREFWIFHYANPEVYRQLVYYAKQWRKRHQHCAISLLFERVRWEMNLKTEAADGFQLNNNHRAFYARLIEEQEGMSGFFRFRSQRIQCSFGPDNSELPPGEHVA